MNPHHVIFDPPEKENIEAQIQGLGDEMAAAASVGDYGRVAQLMPVLNRLKVLLAFGSKETFDEKSKCAKDATAAVE